MPATPAHAVKPDWDISARRFSQSSLLRGLCAYWLFNEGGGLIARDLAKKNHLTVGTQTLFGKSAGLPGVFSNEVHDISNLAISGLPAIDAAHTMAVWMNFITTTSSTVRTFLSYGASGSSNNLAHRAGGSSNGGFGIYTGSSGQYTCAGNAPNEGIRHIVYTFDGSTRSLYYDTVPQSTSFTAQNSNAFSGLRLFKNLNNSFPEFAGAGTGFLSIGFWNRALSAAEVRGLYEGHRGLFQKTPRQYWWNQDAEVAAAAVVSGAGDDTPLALTMWEACGLF